MGSFLHLQNFHTLALDDLKGTHIEGMRDVRRVRRKVGDHSIVDHGELNNVNRHVRRMTVDKEDMWFSVNLAVVEKPPVELAEKVEEDRPLHHGRDGNRLCGAWHASSCLIQFS